MSCQSSNNETLSSLLLANLSLLCLSANLQKNANSRQQVSCEYPLPERYQQHERLCAKRGAARQSGA